MQECCQTEGVEDMTGNTREFDTVVRKVTRRQSSPSGNPRKMVHTDDGTFTTERDSAIAYGISDNWWDTPVHVTVTRAGVLLNIEVRDDEA
jgi:hypothetical protein